MAPLQIVGLVALLNVGPAPTAVDTVVAVEPGRTVSMRNFGGRIVVDAWDRPEVSVRGEGDARRPPRIASDGDALRILGQGRGGHPMGGTVRVTIPAGQPLEIRGRDVDVRVAGTRGRVRVRSLQGSIELQDVSGDVEARSVNGTVRARGVSGRAFLRSTDEDVELVGGGGTVTAESVDGDVTLVEVRASGVSATSVDGDVRFSGRLSEGGSYRLSTHDGDLTVTLVEPVSARVTVSTFDGEFRADFPVTLERFSGGREMRFTLGAGGAELRLEAFDGDIRLRTRRR